MTALPYLPTPSLLSVGANPYGQAGADRRDLFASALAVMLPVSAVSALRYRLAGVDPLPRSLLPLLLPAAAGGLLGAFLLERTSPRRLRRLFAAVIPYPASGCCSEGDRLMLFIHMLASFGIAVLSGMGVGSAGLFVLYRQRLPDCPSCRRRD